IASVLNESFRNYLVGQFTEALIMGTLCLIGLSIFRFPYAPIIAALMAVGVLIPIFGAYIGAIAGFILVSSVSPVQGFFFLIFIIVVTQIEGNLIYPRVAGFNLGLPGIWILAAVIVWGALFGFPGMIFGVPLTAALYKLLKENMKGRAEKKAAEKDNETKPPASEGDLSGTEQSIETLNNENKGNL
ncbi:MAG: AI-2E family transporter, partial [Lachnospiraceae bacterium]|nr:AI-2E family transporter [Lachnospiraceae bacterium]